MAMDERTLCARLKAWIDAELKAHHYADLTRSENEVHATGGHLRHDVAIYAGPRIAFTFEVRTPKHRHGSSPYDAELMAGAREKAEAEGLDYFGTFNCGSFVLWKVHVPHLPPPRRHIRRWPVVPAQVLAHLDRPSAERAIQEFLPQLLAALANIREGQTPSPGGADEDQIVDLIDDRLDTIVGLTLPGVQTQFDTDKTFATALRSWILAQQWTWDDESTTEALLRATKVSCYLVMNQLLFYETMRRRFPTLVAVDLTNARDGQGVLARLVPRFAHAMKESRDYETVFNVGWITNLAFVANDAVAAWSALVLGIREVDLATVSLDLLGGIFERLLSPEERHKFGQHYSSPELADLLLAAAVKDRDAVVFDPSSGGGTFLVRAYARKRYLGRKDHLVLLGQLYGNDVSPFAAHLAVLNLAVRELAPEENYPRVGTHDFLALEPGAPLVRVPDGNGHRDIPAPLTVDAVVGNPPYVRRQNISRDQWRSAQRSRQAFPPPRPEIHELSDLHTYFWLHATRFLPVGAMLAFLSPSAWLETTSGASLKAFLLERYDILLIAESSVEPWFSDARVHTVATVARRRESGGTSSGTVVFAQITTPLRQAFGPPTSVDRWPQVEAFLAAMLQGTPTDARVWRVPQKDLEAGASWSVHLRAPDLFVTWRHFAGVVPVVDSFTVTVGPKLGHGFFLVEDVTETLLAEPQQLRQYGVTKAQVTGATPRFRIVRGLADWVGPIETEFLARTIRSPKGERTRRLRPGTGNLCLFIPRDAQLKGSRVAAYVAHGEKHKIDQGVYTSGRTPWFSIEPKPRGPIIYPHAFQFGHKVWLNPRSAHYTTSPNAYLTPRPTAHGKVPAEAAALVLNSTWVYLDAIVVAGAVGVEGNTRFGGLTQWKRLHVPDLSRFTPAHLARLSEIWKEMRDDRVNDFAPAGNEPLAGWRRELDELVVQVAGGNTAAEARAQVDALYAWLHAHIAQRSDVEAQAVRHRTKDTGRPVLRRVAEQVVETLALLPPWLTQMDVTWTAVDLPSEGVSVDPQLGLFGNKGKVEDPRHVRFGEVSVELPTVAQADFVRTLAQANLAPSPCPVPPASVAVAIAIQAARFAEDLPDQLQAVLQGRLATTDPQFDPTFAQALNLATTKVRTHIAEHLRDRAGLRSTASSTIAKPRKSRKPR